MKKLISPIVGIIALSGTCICIANPTYMYTFHNHTDERLYFGPFTSKSSNIKADDYIDPHKVGRVKLTIDTGCKSIKQMSKKMSSAGSCPAYGSFKYGLGNATYHPQTHSCFVFYQHNDNYEFHGGTDGTLLTCRFIPGSYDIIISKTISKK
jgi:hypothetical protein